jgi:hypothetical protein
MSKTSGADSGFVATPETPTVRDAHSVTHDAQLGFRAFLAMPKADRCDEQCHNSARQREIRKRSKSLSATVPERSNYWGPLWGPL